MKKIRYSSLRFQQESSDKVYEVEVIERHSREDARYLVNFRHGQFGAYLQEGSKTRKPVFLAEAEQLFNSVVVAQLNKGYSLVSGDNPLAEQSISPQVQDVTNQKPVQNREIGSDSNFHSKERQKSVFNQFLQLKGSSKTREYIRCSRLIWRLGELEMRDAAPALLESLEHYWQQRESRTVTRVYSLVWALGRCGDASALHLLETIVATHQTPIHVRRMAIQAAWHLVSEQERANWLVTYYQQLPEALQSIAQTGIEGSVQDQAGRMLYWAQSHKPRAQQADDESEVWFAILWLRAKTDSHLRQVLLEVCRIAPLEFGSVWLIRLYFKMAEFELDAEFLAVLIPRIESSPARLFIWTASEPERQTYQRSTRDYFRRRSWRLLRRLGELGKPQFVDIASKLLQQYDEANSQAQTIEKYLWEGGRYTRYSYHLPPFCNHIALNQLLYRHSEKFLPQSSGTCWYQATESKESKRCEAFPQLWDAQPAAFIDCLKHSRYLAVHEFALRGLSTQANFLSGVAANDWVKILCCPFESSASFAQQQLERFHTAALSDVRVLAQIIKAETPRARLFAHQQLNQLTDEQLLVSVDWHAQMIVSPYEDNRKQARHYHARYPQGGEKQQLLLGKLISYAQGSTPQQVPSASIFNSLSWSITEPLADTTRSLDFAVITDLLAHPLVEVQRLGAEILVVRKDKPADLPDGVFQGLIESDDPELRAAGVNLLGNLDDDELAQMSELLATLLVSVDAPVRIQTQKIIARVAANKTEFSEQLLPELVNYAFRAEPVEGAYEEMLACVENDLQTAWPIVDNAQLWRLLTARSRTAQRMGSILLQPRAAAGFSLQQWARLGKHNAQDTRRWAQQAYTDNVDHVRTNLTAGLMLLDTDWQDTRHFALDYFRAWFSAEEWTEDHLVFLCDSTRDDVQRLGRDLLREYFQAEQGESYLLKLSQHPARNVQLFASEFLQDYATGQPEIISQLQPYFITVLSTVNRGRVAKDRVMDFLLHEARQDKQVAEQLSAILERQSVTVAIQDKAGFIQAMLSLSRQYPGLKLPLQNVALPLRGGKSEAA